MKEETFWRSLKANENIKNINIEDVDFGEVRIEDTVSLFADLFFDCMAENIRHTKDNSEEGVEIYGK